MTKTPTWTDEQLDTIRTAWTAGPSTAQIGRLIGRTPAAASRPIPPATACEYPLGERGAYIPCGAPISRGSYCTEHAAVCYLDQREGFDAV